MHKQARRRLTISVVAFALVAALLGAGGATTAVATPVFPGFDAPLIGHSGFRNLPIFLNVSEEAEYENIFDAEAEMGLKWSFTAVMWPLFEPIGPTSAANDLTGAWGVLDRWVAAARERGLNLILEPIMSTNTVAPPPWVGYRIPAGCAETQSWTDPKGNQHSRDEFCVPAGLPRAPRDMSAMEAFFGKLARRYRPGGELAITRGWTDGYGVRAWEIDLEPDDYGFWFGQLDDYAEVVTRAAQEIKKEDPTALILGPGAAQMDSDDFMYAVLDKRMQEASLEYKLNGTQYALGPWVDVFSAHHYDTVPAVESGTTIDQTYDAQRAWFEFYADHPGQPEFAYPHNKPMWHTEGGIDFAGSENDDDVDLRARATIQFLTKGFAAGFDKMVVMDLHLKEEPYAKARRAVRVFSDLFPHAVSIERVTTVGTGPQVFLAPDGSTRTYVAWSGTDQNQTYGFPASAPVRVIDAYGNETTVTPSGGVAVVTLPGGARWSWPVYVIATS